MALIKSKELKNGLVVSYHRVFRFIVSKNSAGNFVVEYYVASYKDKNVRDADISAYADGKDCNFTLTPQEFADANIVDACYIDLQKSNIVDDVETNWWTDAESDQ